MALSQTLEWLTGHGQLGGRRWTSRLRLSPTAPDLDMTASDPQNEHGSGGGAISLREVLVGMIEEYARHMGHVDLLRERIDGRVGQ